MEKKEWTTPRVFTFQMSPDDLADPVIAEWFEEGYKHAQIGLPMRDDLTPFSCAAIAYSCGYHLWGEVHAKLEPELFEAVP